MAFHVEEATLGKGLTDSIEITEPPLLTSPTNYGYQSSFAREREAVSDLCNLAFEFLHYIYEPI